MSYCKSRDESISYLIGPDDFLRSDTRDLTVKQSFLQGVKLTGHHDNIGDKGASHIARDRNNELILTATKTIKINSDISWRISTDTPILEALVPHTADGRELYQSYIEKYGYSDFFLMEPEGEIFYSATREADFQTNIVSGKYSDSNLGGLVRDVLTNKSYGIVDFSPYAPSNGEPAAFIAQPILAENGDVSMVVALQLSLEAINSVMTLRDGMGETGESYLVGSDNRMRSDSYLDPVNRTVKASFAGSIANNGVDTQASREALSGNTGTGIIEDYNGNTVLASYSPLDIGDIRWALLAEIEESEAFAALNAIEKMLVTLLIIAVVITALIAVYLANSIKKPLGGEPRGDDLTGRTGCRW